MCGSVAVYANMTVSKNVLTSGTTECVTVSLCVRACVCDSMSMPMDEYVRVST